MTKLNGRAFEILRAEVERSTTDNPIGKTEKQIVMKRLEKLRQEKGSAVTLDELRDTVFDIYPQFREKVIKQAVKANRPSGIVAKMTLLLAFIAGSAGIVWLANLPNPIIRKSVAKTAPILLIPSFMSMDYHYRGAID
jgi:hypothetical protein